MNMLRESPYPMVSVAEARRIIAGLTLPLGIEELDLLAALRSGVPVVGRVLAEDIVAPADLPDVPKSAVDGYALRAADGMQPRRVLAEITAGAQPGLHIEPGTAARIMTGAPVPAGADAVVMVEQTEESGGVLQIHQAVRSGNSIHTVGQDIARGQVVLSHGATLTAPDLGLLATVGRTRVRVYRRPLVAVLATGDEVFEPDSLPETGGVRDSNRYALLAAAHEAGCDTVSLGIARDDLAVQRAAIRSALDRADVLLTSGGVSMGTRDLIKPLLAELGTVHFGRVSFKPGKPTTFATLERPPRAPLLAFGLPGYPVSSLVSFEVFVRPALRRLQGAARPERPLVQVALVDPIRPSPDRPEYQRAVVRWQDGHLTAQSTGAQGSSRLLSLRDANALLLVPAGEQVYPAGALLEAMLMGPLAE